MSTVYFFIKFFILRPRHTWFSKHRSAEHDRAIYVLLRTCRRGCSKNMLPIILFCAFRRLNPTKHYYFESGRTCRIRAHVKNAYLSRIDRPAADRSSSKGDKNASETIGGLCSEEYPAAVTDGRVWYVEISKTNSYVRFVGSSIVSEHITIYTHAACTTLHVDSRPCVQQCTHIYYSVKCISTPTPNVFIVFTYTCYCYYYSVCRA